MKVKKLIKKLRKLPQNLEVVTYSDNYEQSGSFQKIHGLNPWNISENFKFILNGRAGNVSAPFEILHMRTSMYKGLTVHELIEELLKYDEKKLVVYHPDGFTLENRYNEIKKIRIMKCGLMTLTFHDLMDHDTYSSEVYSIDCPDGEEKVVLL